MSRPNVVFVRFQNKFQVKSMVSALVAMGYEVQEVGIMGSIAVWNDGDLVFSATRMQGDKFFCRASGAYMTPDDVAVVI